MKSSRPTKTKLIAPILGTVCILGACTLYYRDIQNNKSRIDAVNAVRMCVQAPISTMGLLLDTTDVDVPYMACPVDLATNILTRLSLAEPTDFPKGIVQGDEYRIMLLATNGVSTTLRAVRLYDDPDNLYVGIQQPIEFDADNKPTKFGYTDAAKVTKLGNIFSDLAAQNLDTLRTEQRKAKKFFEEHNAKIAEEANNPVEPATEDSTTPATTPVVSEPDVSTPAQ